MRRANIHFGFNIFDVKTDVSTALAQTFEVCLKYCIKILIFSKFLIGK